MLFLSFTLCIEVQGAVVYEYELSDTGDKNAQSKLSRFMDSLPEEIKNELPDKNSWDFEDYDTAFFSKVIESALKKALKPAIETLCMLLVCVIISAAFHIFADNLSGESLKGIFSLCSSLCFSLSIFASLRSVFLTVESLLSVLSETMMGMIPVMEAVYISSGNLTTATVTSTGVTLMIGFTQTLFSRVLFPAAYSLFILAVCSAVTKNRTVLFMTRMMKGLIIGGITLIMTLMTFVLSLQSNGAAMADGLAVKTVKFAIGSYIPIVGGGLAESFSVLSSSLNVIRQGSGIVGIAVILIAFLPPFAMILMSRIAIAFSEAISTVLGCESEGELLCECKGICTLLLSISAAAAVMYIIALGIFCKTPLALG